MAPLNQLLLFASKLLLGLFGLFVRRRGTLAYALLLRLDVVQAELGDVLVLVLSLVDHWWWGGQVAKPDKVELHCCGVRIRIMFYCYRQMLCLLVFDLGNGRVDYAGLVTVLADVV